MTITKDNPEALVEDLMAGVRESLNNDDYKWITKIQRLMRTRTMRSPALTRVARGIIEYRRRRAVGDWRML